MLSKPIIRDALVTALREPLAERGFRARKADGSFLRKIEGGHQRFSLAIVDYWPTYRISVPIVIRFEDAATIYNRFAGVPEEYGKETDILISNLDHFGAKRRHEVSTASELGQAIEQLRSVMVRDAIPFLDQCMTVEALDRVLTATDGAFDQTEPSGKALKRIVVAGLANNADFDAVAERCTAVMAQYPEEQKTLRDCVAHMKSLRRA